MVRAPFALFLVATWWSCAADSAFAQTEAKPRRPQHLLAVLIGGWDSDPTPRQIAGTAGRGEGNSGLFQMAGDLKRERVIPEYFNWNGTRAGELKTAKPPGSGVISNLVRDHLQAHPFDRVALVGNSMGGHTALEVAEQLVKHEAPVAVHCVIFLDASSAGRAVGKPRLLPVNIDRAAHYYTRNVFVWGKWMPGPVLENIDLGDPASGYMSDGVPAYNATFDFRAHVAAEWDEKIHADIRRRVLGLLGE